MEEITRARRADLITVKKIRAKRRIAERPLDCTAVPRESLPSLPWSREQIALEL